MPSARTPPVRIRSRRDPRFAGARIVAPVDVPGGCGPRRRFANESRSSNPRLAQGVTKVARNAGRQAPELRGKARSIRTGGKGGSMRAALVVAGLTLSGMGIQACAQSTAAVSALESSAARRGVAVDAFQSAGALKAAPVAVEAARTLDTTAVRASATGAVLAAPAAGVKVDPIRPSLAPGVIGARDRLEVGAVTRVKGARSAKDPSLTPANADAASDRPALETARAASGSATEAAAPAAAKAPPPKPIPYCG